MQIKWNLRLLTKYFSPFAQFSYKFVAIGRKLLIFYIKFYYVCC